MHGYSLFLASVSVYVLTFVHVYVCEFMSDLGSIKFVFVFNCN